MRCTNLCAVCLCRAAVCRTVCHVRRHMQCRVSCAVPYAVYDAVCRMPCAVRGGRCAVSHAPSAVCHDWCGAVRAYLNEGCRRCGRRLRELEPDDLAEAVPCQRDTVIAATAARYEGARPALCPCAKVRRGHGVECIRWPVAVEGGAASETGAPPVPQRCSELRQWEAHEIRVRCTADAPACAMRSGSRGRSRHSARAR